MQDEYVGIRFVVVVLCLLVIFLGHYTYVHEHFSVNTQRIKYLSVLSCMQTDAPTPHIVGPTMLRPAVYHGKDTTHKTEETMCDRRARPQQCWKSFANGSNNVALHFGDHVTKEMLGVVG